MKIQQDSLIGRGLKTAVQAIIGFFVGLVMAVWAVPGVPDTVIAYVQENVIQLALLIGIPSGIASFLWNLPRTNVPLK